LVLSRRFLALNLQQTRRLILPISLMESITDALQKPLTIFHQPLGLDFISCRNKLR
jgi:hypothetical protein